MKVSRQQVSKQKLITGPEQVKLSSELGSSGSQFSLPDEGSAVSAAIVTNAATDIAKNKTLGLNNTAAILGLISRLPPLILATLSYMGCTVA